MDVDSQHSSFQAVSPIVQGQASGGVAHGSATFFFFFPASLNHVLLLLKLSAG